MHVRPVTSFEELCALESGWNALAGDMPFRTWDWLATWWKHYGRATTAGDTTRHRLHVLTVHDDDLSATMDSTERHGDAGLLGIAPFYVERSATRGNVLRLLGTGEVCTDHLSLIGRPQYQTRVAKALADHLTMSDDTWDAIELSGIDADDSSVSSLLTTLEDRACEVERRPADACWIVQLPDSWEDYLASQSKSHRKQLRRIERRVFESGRGHWHLVHGREELAFAWELLVDLHQQRRRSLGEPGCFASRSFTSFHQEVVARLLARGQLRLSWLELDGSPVAAEYHLSGGTTTFAYQGGLDPARLDDEPGRVSTAACLQAAIAEGHRTFDLLRGDEPYKAHFRAQRHPTFDYRVVPDRRLARLRGRAVCLADTMAEWVKSSTHALTGEKSLGG